MKVERPSYILYFLGLTGILVLAVLWTPTDDGPTICYSKALFDVSCPGCGLTRSVAALVKGEVGASVQYHALGPVFLAIIIWLWGLLGWCLIKNKPMPPLKKFHWPAVALIVAMVGYWIIRATQGTLP